MRLVVAAVGAQAAKDLFFTARRIDAAEALRLGAVGRVAPASGLEEAVAELARTWPGTRP
jgi:enoyl-CoA hydratase/carnithine racemase